MSASMEPLSRTASGESTRSHSSFQLLQRAPSSISQKSRPADVEAHSTEVPRADISMPPPALRPTGAPRAQRVPSNNYASRAPDAGIMDVLSGQTPASLSASNLDLAGRASDEAQAQASMPLAPSPQGSRRSDPEVDTASNKRMSISSLYNLRKSAPSSVAGSSDQDGPVDNSGRTTTAAQHLSVTTQSQNGALSPSLNSSLREAQFLQHTTQANTSSPTTMPSHTSPTPQPSRDRESRTTNRGRTPGASRRVSNSGPNSASVSTERPLPSERNPNKIGTIGICALDSKARSKPSRSILNRLVGKANDFDVVIFGDKIILDEDVENWPVCDFLISFFSDGFPLEKAIAYAKLRRPFCVNDIPMQTVLWDRRLCLLLLDQFGVPTPPRLEINRDGGPVVLSTDIAQRMYQLSGVRLTGPDGRGGLVAPPRDIHMEDDGDTLVVDGKRLTKPFVEKPVSGEDHNINIYYPKSQGGGGRRLFRKVNNKSSEKDENLTVPLVITDRESSYIYEQFLKVENAEDVKAYTVGTDFCHAETRKSPVVDGVVKRNPNGKEVRYVTSLTKEEQIMAAKIASGFGQRVCGFDLLRVGDASYVIDVNGWSFVKDNNEYYDKCASIMKSMFIREKLRWEGRSTPTVSETDEKEYNFPPTGVPDRGSENRKPTLSKDQERGHRNALKSVFRSRSISQLRDSVSNAAHKVGHPVAGRSPSGTTSPLSSHPTIERTPSFPKSTVSKHESLPPPAVPPASMLKDVEYADRPSVDVDSIAEAPSNYPAPASKSQWKLKGMVAVIRHGDRTPKQKFKFTFHTKPFVDLLKGHQEEVLLVGEAALRSVQAAVKQALEEGLEDKQKLRVLQNALARKGSWPGTKVQIKPMFKNPKKDGEKKKEKGEKHVGNDAKQADVPVASQDFPITTTPEAQEVEQWQKKVAGEIENSTEGDGHETPAGLRNDSLGDVTMSRTAAAENNLVLDKLQLVMKWGGEPTHSARYQATDLGDNMRNDLLLMNRDVLSDVAIFSSSERRVTTSAQIFAGAFLGETEIEDHHITVRKDLLDDSNAAKDEMDKVKKKLKGLLRQGQEAPEQFAWPKNTPEPYVVVRNVVDLMKFHRRVMRANFSKLATSEAVTALERVKTTPTINSADADFAIANGGAQPVNPTSTIQSRWCTGEDAELFKERWEKLFNEFTDPEKVDPSKISELYDTMKFDALHNRQFLEWVFTPSQSMLLEEEVDDQKLTRTESVVAREEYAHTHNGAKPASEPNIDPEIKGSDKSTKSGNSSTGDGQSAERERHSVSLTRRLKGRRKSTDLVSVARNATSGVNAEDSYFNLYRGSSTSSGSKFRDDVRLEKLNKLYGLSKILFNFIGPQEYGITDAEKLEIGLLTSLPLLKEIVKDLEDMQASDDAKSFIYFTKESHIYTLLNCVLEGGITTKIARNAIPELDYLSQICFELYESENAAADVDPENPESNFNYSIRISISPGCHTFDPLDVQLDSKHCIGCAPRRTLMSHGDWKDVLATLRAKFHTVKLPKSFVAVNLSEKMAMEGEEQENVESKGGGDVSSVV